MAGSNIKKRYLHQICAKSIGYILHVRYVLVSMSSGGDETFWATCARAVDPYYTLGCRLSASIKQD